MSSPAEQKQKGDSPFFSIGLTTYHRRELLQEALRSIRAQTFEDFEVLVGNDYPAEVLSRESLGIEDERIRIFNHSHNMGEVANMNDLLERSRGRYFTWLGDDDLYAPRFLEETGRAIREWDFPPSVFTSYEILPGLVQPPISRPLATRRRCFSGPEFLRSYFSGETRVIGPYGVFETKWLREIGGIQPLCKNSAIGLFGEYGLLFRVSHLDRIIYVDAPLVYYRFHPACGASHLKTEEVILAGEELVRRSVEFLVSSRLRPDFSGNILAIFHLCTDHFYNKLFAEKGAVSWSEMSAYWRRLEGCLECLRGDPLHRCATLALRRIKGMILWRMLKADFRKVVPAAVIQAARRFRSMLFPRKSRPFWN